MKPVLNQNNIPHNQESAQDTLFMRHALHLALHGQYTAHPNPRVGCVLVKNNQIIGEGLHWQRGLAHAETYALAQAKENAAGATCYITLEPCVHQGHTGPCVEALIQSGVNRVVISTLDPNPVVTGKGVAALQAASIEVKLGVLAEETSALNKGFFSRMSRNRPFVRAKIGMSLDGRIAMANGESQWITSPQAREDVQRWRAGSGAILTGSGTVKQDNCQLNVRAVPPFPEGVNFEQPLRIIASSQCDVSTFANIFHSPGKVIIATLEKSLKNAGEFGDNVEIIALAEKNGRIDLAALLSYLAEREINDLLVEAGPTLSGALLQQGLIDELLIYIAPKLLGDDAKPMVHLAGLTNLSDHIGGEFGNLMQVGSDLHLTVKLSDFARKI